MILLFALPFSRIPAGRHPSTTSNKGLLCVSWLPSLGKKADKGRLGQEEGRCERPHASLSLSHLFLLQPLHLSSFDRTSVLCGRVDSGVFGKDPAAEFDGSVPAAHVIAFVKFFRSMTSSRFFEVRSRLFASSS